MKNKIIKAGLYILLIIILIYGGFNLAKFVLKGDKYRGIFYPDGCLACDNYIVSPDLNSAEDCVKGGEDMKEARANINDRGECGKNCEGKDGFSVCEDTFGEGGTGDHY